MLAMDRPSAGWIGSRVVATPVLPPCYQRPPLATDCLTESSGGQLLYELPHARRNGSTHLLLDPLVLIEKLGVLIPRPGFTCFAFTACWPPVPSFAPPWSRARAGRPTWPAHRRQARRRPSPGGVPSTHSTRPSDAFLRRAWWARPPS